MGDGRPSACARRLAAILTLAVPLCVAPSPAVAQSVQITGLNDVPIGPLPLTGADTTKPQSVCANAGVLGGRYTVMANGSGTGNAFTLQNGSSVLPYEVQWAGSSGQTSGTNLTPGNPLAGQSMLLACTFGSTNASLIVIVRGTSVLNAVAGNYSGTLTIILSAN